MKRDGMRPDKYFQDKVDEGLSPCFSIARARDGQVDYRLDCGSEKRGGRAISDGIRFNIASVTKPVTALLAIKLMEAGQLTLNDAVKTFIPEYPFDDVTVFNLMTHTSGYDEMHIVPWPSRPEERGEFYARIYGIHQRKYETGERAAYWTFNYAILADIMQRVTGMSLEFFARQTLFEPLGMDHSTFELSALGQEELFLPWYDRENRFFPEACVPVATGDSGLYTTADDLIRIPMMLLAYGVWNGKTVLSEAGAALMLRESTGGKFMKSPGLWLKGDCDIYGCFGDLNSPLAAGHTGMTGCMMIADPQYRTAAVILTNSLRLHEDWRNYKRILNVLMAMD